MAKLVDTELFPEWEDQKLETGCHGASVGHCDDTDFVNKLSRNIHFDWMKKTKKSVIEKALGTVDTLNMPEGDPNVWSMDFILEENLGWLIDMAQGWRSIYWNRERAGV